MRMHLIAILLAGVGATAAAQSTPQSGRPASKGPAPKTLTLSGCVQPSDSSPTQFTFEDDSQPKAPATYRLSGADVKKYAGKRVEIVGGIVSPRLKIATGLRPSPNVAGQAGAMDPTQAVIAGSSGGAASGTGTAELPEFRVKSVKPLAGDCRP
jgi:hypothetical protein